MISFYKMIASSKRASLKVCTEQVNQFLIDNTSSSSSLISKDLTVLFTASNTAIQQSIDLVNKLEKEVIELLEIFSSSISAIYSENNAEYSSIIDNINEAKDRLDGQKAIYYKSAYEASSLTHNKAESIEEQGMSSIEASLRIKSKAESNELLYKYELSRFNIIAEECNERYTTMITNLKQHEESRVNYIRLSIEKYKKLIREYNVIYNELSEKIANLLSKDNCNREITSILSGLSSNMIKQNDKESRFMKESFTSYNDYVKKNKIEACIEQYESIQLKTKLSKEEQCKVIEESVMSLLDDKEIDAVLIAKLMEVLQTNSDNSKKFLDTFLLKKVNIWVCFGSYSNLVHLANVLSFISLSHSSIEAEKFEVNFTVLLITERVFYKEESSKRKVYFSALLSQKPVYQMHSFWKDVIELKLAKKLGDVVPQLNKMKLPEDESVNIFSKLGYKIGNKLGLNSKGKSNNVIENSRIRKFISSIDELDMAKTSAFDIIATKELIAIIEETIPQMAYFSFPIFKTMDLINELAEEYRIPNRQIDQYLNAFTVYSFSVRKNPLNSGRPIHNITEEKFRMYLRLPSQDRIAKMITVSLAYLTSKDFMPILLLNKAIHKKVSVKIFKIALKKPHLPINSRLSIWSSILRVNTLKREFDYKQLSSDLSNVSEITKNDIKIDVPRTFISPQLNQLSARSQVQNVLLALSQVNGDIKYCQGMNYFSQFLLEISGNEECAFYLFLGFFKSTEYSLIFSKDLHKMKMFSHIFQRLLALYEPELSVYLASTNFEVSFFLVPWFITLFQSTRPSITDKGLPMVLVRVIDEFLTAGWKAMMSIGINLLKHYETELLNMKYEDLLQFLMNNGMNVDFFANSNLALFDAMLAERKISKQLVDCIKEEFRFASEENENKPQE